MNSSKPRLHKLTVEASEIEVRHRFAYFARQSSPRFTAKWLQGQLDISESTAERILRGEASQANIVKALQCWGRAFYAFVFERAAGPSQAFLDDELNDLRARLDALETGEIYEPAEARVRDPDATDFPASGQVLHRTSGSMARQG